MLPAATITGSWQRSGQHGQSLRTMEASRPQRLPVRSLTYEWMEPGYALQKRASTIEQFRDLRQNPFSRGAHAGGPPP